MAEWALLPKTLDYGRQSATAASWLTLIVILALSCTIYLLLKCQHMVCKPPTTKDGRRKASKIKVKEKHSKAKTFLKAMPGISAAILIIVGIWWFIGEKISIQSSNWQADYFVGFFFVMFTWCLLLCYQSVLKLRRTTSWYLLNGMFKTFSVIFAGMALVPYYVYTTVQETKFWESPLTCMSFFIFLAYTLICLYVFRASPFSTLIPMIVLWGASISYYTTWYAIQYAIIFNGSSLIVGVLSALGISSFFGGIAKHTRAGAAPQFMFAYCVIMFIIIAGFWTVMWTHYDVPMFGTDYEQYHSSSFYK